MDTTPRHPMLPPDEPIGQPVILGYFKPRFYTAGVDDFGVFTADAEDAT